MLLQPLTDALALVQNRAENYRQAFSSNEQQTRLSLVDPILKALGWDPQDPEFVKVEFLVKRSTQNTRIDYALLDSKQQPIAFVEAKSLETDITDAHFQLFKYAVGKTVPYLIATNGLDWSVYKWEQHSAGMGLSKLLAISITAEPMNLVAIKLLSLWRGMLTSIASIDQIAPALEQLELPVPDPEPVVPVLEPTDQSNNEENPGSRTVNNHTFALNSPPEHISGGKPDSLKFPNSLGQEEIELRNWSSILIETTKRLSKSNQLNVQIPWKHRPTSKRNVLQASTIYSSKGLAIKAQVEIEPKIFLQYNFDATEMCEVTAKLLGDCGFDSSSFTVTFEPKG